MVGGGWEEDSLFDDFGGAERARRRLTMSMQGWKRERLSDDFGGSERTVSAQGLERGNLFEDVGVF